MKILKFLFLLFIPTLCFSQNTELDSLMSRVSELAKERRSNYWNDSRDSIFKEFENTFLKAITHDAFCGQDVDGDNDLKNLEYNEEDKGVSLVYGMMNAISHCTSPDGKLSMFSWDDLGGGSYHSYTNYSLIYNDTMGCFVERFDTLTMAEFMDFEQKIDVGYYNIDQISYADNVYYFLSGFGTYGGGKEHQAMRIYEIIDNKLIESFSSYPNQEPLVFYCNRGQEIGMQFENGILSYNQFEYEDNSGFYGITSKPMKLEFIEGKFIPIE